MAEVPNQLWVSDCTYVSTWQDCVCAAFGVDVFARRIAVWRVSSFMRTKFLLDALEQAMYDRQPGQLEGWIHHSDRGLERASDRYSESLAEASMESSVGQPVQDRIDHRKQKLRQTANGDSPVNPPRHDLNPMDPTTPKTVHFRSVSTIL